MKRLMLLGLVLLVMLFSVPAVMAQEGAEMVAEVVTVPVDYTPLIVLGGVGYALIFVFGVGAYYVFKPVIDNLLKSLGALGEGLATSVPGALIQPILQAGYEATLRIPGEYDDEIYHDAIRAMGYEMIVGADGSPRFVPITSAQSAGMFHRWTDGTLALEPESPPTRQTEVIEEATPNA